MLTEYICELPPYIWQHHSTTIILMLVLALLGLLAYILKPLCVEPEPETEKFLKVKQELLADRTHFSDSWVQDYISHVKNRHPLVGICACDSRHPYSKRERCCMLTIVLIFALNWTPVVNFWMGPQIYWNFHPCHPTAYTSSHFKEEMKHWMVRNYTELCDATEVFSTTLVNSTETQAAFDKARSQMKEAAPVAVLGGRFLFITLPLMVLQATLSFLATADERFNLCRRRRLHNCNEGLMLCITRSIKVIFWIVSIVIPPYIIFMSNINGWRLRWKFYNDINADTSALRTANNLETDGGMKKFKHLLISAYLSDVLIAVQQVVLAWLTWFLGDLFAPFSGFGPPGPPSFLPVCLYKRWKDPKYRLGELPDDSDASDDELAALSHATDSDDEDEE